MNEEDIFKTLNYIFTDENILLEIGTYYNSFHFQELMYKLNEVLNYYITTRDRRILSLYEIEDNYTWLKNSLPTKEELDNILINGYLTHSFPGVEKKYIKDFGFDYFYKLPREEQERLQVIRSALRTLEQNISECKYLTSRRYKNQDDITNKEIFMTFPGAKTIYYSVFAPERLYRGPIDTNLFTMFPMVVGESKKDYLMRIIKYRIKNKSTITMSSEELLLVAESVMEYYSKDNPCIAFINIDSIKNIPIYDEIYNYGRCGRDAFRQYYSAMLLNEYELKFLFTTEMSDQVEMFNRGNYVTLSSFIDKTSISLVDFPDWYNLRQSYLKKVGIHDGTLVFYNDCKQIENFDDISDDIKVLYRKL